MKYEERATTNETMSLLQVENLQVDISLAAGDLHAVRGVSFGVEKGKTLGLVGESGCGKSISALAVMNLLPPRARRQASRLEFAGQDLRAMSEDKMMEVRGNRMSMISSSLIAKRSWPANSRRDA